MELINYCSKCNKKLGQKDWDPCSKCAKKEIDTELVNSILEREKMFLRYWLSLKKGNKRWK